MLRYRIVKDKYAGYRLQRFFGRYGIGLWLQVSSRNPTRRGKNSASDIEALVQLATDFKEPFEPKAVKEFEVEE